MVARQDLFGGLEAAIETFEQYGDSFDLDLLVKYALRYDMGSVIKRLGWLLDEMGTREETLKPLEDYPVTSYYRLDPRRPRSGHSVSRWHAIDNLSGG